MRRTKWAYKALTDQNLPVLGFVSDLVGSSHLRVGHSSNDKDDEPWSALVALLATVLVPLAIPRTGRKTRELSFYMHHQIDNKQAFGWEM